MDEKTEVKTWDPKDPDEFLQGTIVEVREEGVVVENADGQFLVLINSRGRRPSSQVP